MTRKLDNSIIDRRSVLAGAAAAPGLLGAASSAKAEAICCPIVELRQYTLHAGGRAVLADLFDRTFIEPQEAQGIHVLGQFRDLDDPNRFVWLRGFSDMAARAVALQAFYGGPVWKANRTVANATMIDSDNVLLLRPSRPDAGFAGLRPRAAIGSPPASEGLFQASIHYLRAADAEPFAAFFDAQMAPTVERCGARILARFLTEAAPNSFPALPIRQDETVFVWFARFDGEAARLAFRTALLAAPDWREAAPAGLLPAFARKPEVLRLSPMPRSRLR